RGTEERVAWQSLSTFFSRAHVPLDEGFTHCDGGPCAFHQVLLDGHSLKKAEPRFLGRAEGHDFTAFRGEPTLPLHDLPAYLDSFFDGSPALVPRNAAKAPFRVHLHNQRSRRDDRAEKRSWEIEKLLLYGGHSLPLSHFIPQARSAARYFLSLTGLTACGRLL